jgi:nucleoside-diphosphate kinase
MEKTLVLVKPDGVQRGLLGEIIARLERRGLRLVGAKFLQVSPELAAAHYGEHVGKKFYAGLIDYITSSPVMAMAWEGPNAVAAVRQTLGATRPTEAALNVRHDFALKSGNLAHGLISRSGAKWRRSPADELVSGIVKSTAGFLNKSDKKKDGARRPIFFIYHPQNHFPSGPEIFEAVIIPLFRCEDMENDVPIIRQQPAVAVLPGAS